MRRTTLAGLGAVPRGARRIGLGRPLMRLSRALDAPFLAAGRPPLVSRADGIELRGFLRHRAYLAAFAGGRDEAYYRRVLADALRPAATFVDGGAHLGHYSIVAARRIGPAGRVVAFEPDSYNLRALTSNLARNGAAGVIVRRSALGAGGGTAAFYESEVPVASTTSERQDFAAIRRTTVALTSVDDELEGRPLGRLVVKLDLEGGEPAALAGLSQSAARAADFALLVEVNGAALAHAGSSPQEVFRLIRELGLETQLVDEARAELVPASEPVELPIYNLLCRRD